MSDHDSFRIVTAVDWADCRRPPIGTLWIEGPRIMFPAQGWRERPARVLSMWVQSALDVLSGAESRGVRFPFMEGPHCWIASFAGSRASIECETRTRSGRKCIGLGTVPVRLILDQCADAAIEVTSGAGLHDADGSILSLRAAARKLREAAPP